jgi:hypothetical protein
MLSRFVGKIWLLMFVVLTACGGGSDGATAALPQPPIPTPTIPSIREMRILVIGQSISSNCNQFVYGKIDNVFQIGKDGAVKAAADPFEWADCDKGSMWMPLGKKIIEAGLADKVIFMPIGLGGTSVMDWMSGGRAFSKLNDAIGVIKQQKITFDFVLWHQGSSDFGTSKDDYVSRLSSVIAYVNKNVQVGKWLIAIHSRCWGTMDLNIEAAQRVVGAQAQNGHFLGPDTNTLGDEYRFDTCHLNQRGQEQMATMWLESIKNAQFVKN